MYGSQIPWASDDADDGHRASTATVPPYASPQAEAAMWTPRPVPVRSRTGVALPPAHLLPIIDQLLRGAPDEAASRRLDMSPRTFSRRVAELLDYLDCTSRFQGGAQAVFRGWVPLSRPRPDHAAAKNSMSAALTASGRSKKPKWPQSGMVR